ncbi:11-oxo-beta-amyrin 30-oxidase [Seminavis robusta]|uniref:11-oxo-beta-amyrin 30-oxidase n=1 Tax=Seminavis robusta TaxID=568900 RepID=A0A9N8D8W9_9STRA|nr:11-oxo-beta-amyrin 30-oxidase [Seminavis robusta]|eukprot:Sro1_g000490.1 11-oxo-beta-amyrin 30-oxidase (538) ;mRNA; r:147364-149072
MKSLFPSLLLQVVFALVASIPSVASFAVVPARQRRISRCSRGSSNVVLQASTVGASNSTAATATEEEEDPYQVLRTGGDPTIDAPLPSAFTECPFTGILAGPESFYRQVASKLQSPDIFSFLQKDQPMAEISGGTTVKQVLDQEFTALSSNAVPGVSQIVCGTESLRTARNVKEHKIIRRLVSHPLGASSVAASVPTLQDIGQTCLEETIATSSTSISTLEMTQKMTLEVAWQQLLGFDFDTDAELERFRRKAATWLDGIYHKVGTPEMDATLQAKEYLVGLVDKKINQLVEAGESDGSTLGGLVFAKETDTGKTLTRQQVIDNALFLMLAGTETTSSSLCNIMLLMGLHPNVWQKVVEEQARAVETHGETLTPALVMDDQGFPYLDAVIHEVMRVLPVTLISKRVTTSTMVVDGVQIPPGWGVAYSIYLTHQKALEEGSMDLQTGFKPERWLDPATRPQKPDYMPFGAGPRHCPGALLGMTEQRGFLSLMARAIPKFELEMELDSTLQSPIDEQIEWNKLSAVSTPMDGTRIRILQ